MKKRIHSLTLKTFLWYYVPALVWFLFIWLMSSQEGSGWNGAVSWDYYLERKSAHIFEYAVLAFLVWRVIRLWVSNTKEVLFWTLVWVLWGGVVDEVHQSFIFGREGRIVDVGIDLVGGYIGIFIAQLFLERKK